MRYKIYSIQIHNCLFLFNMCASGLSFINFVKLVLLIIIDQTISKGLLIHVSSRIKLCITISNHFQFYIAFWHLQYENIKRKEKVIERFLLKFFKLNCLSWHIFILLFICRSPPH